MLDLIPFFLVFFVLPYFLFWFVFVFPALYALRRISNSVFLCLVLFLTILIGFRVQVGGDWYNYFGYLERSFGLSLELPFGQSNQAMLFLTGLLLTSAAVFIL